MTPRHDRPDPGCIDHEALYTRIDDTEQRIIALMKWGATTVLGIVLMWAGHNSKFQERIQERDMRTAAALAEIHETNKNVNQSLRSLYTLVEERTSDVEAELNEHERTPDAHYRHNGRNNDATAQRSVLEF